MLLGQRRRRPVCRMQIVDILGRRDHRESLSAVDGALRCCVSAGTDKYGGAMSCRQLWTMTSSQCSQTEVFKILHNYYDSDVAPKLTLNNASVTRGNSLKLLNQSFHYDIRKYSFLLVSLIHFKNRLDRF